MTKEVKVVKSECYRIIIEDEDTGFYYQNFYCKINHSLEASLQIAISGFFVSRAIAFDKKKEK